MLKKMRLRFVFSAMLAITAVMGILVIGINAWNYSVTLEQIDTTIHGLMETGQHRIPPDRRERRPPTMFFGKSSKEDPYMMRYFSVRMDASGNVIEVGMDFISSISEEEAIAYASYVLEKGKEAGFYGEYRYVMQKTQKEAFLFFLNVSKEQQFMKILLLISSLVAVISILVLFLLLFLFSKQAIRPYIENIERQKKFITDASHEIKTPLTSIVTSAEVLAMEDGENEWVVNIQKQINRLSKLVENLVTLSRLDEGTPFPEQKEFFVSEAIWEIIEPFVTLAKAKKKTFRYQIAEDLHCFGDRSSIQQMLSILLDNALKYSDDKGQIWLLAYRQHRSLVIEVSNTCEGKDIQEPERLFDRFYRPDEARTAAAGGYGIGLSIAKAIVEAHHGKISVRCQNKKEITFQAVLAEHPTSSSFLHTKH